MNNYINKIVLIVHFIFQVDRVLHLFYRLVVQPNTSRAHTFAEAFLACGGVETLLVLLQREAKAGDSGVLESLSKNPELQKAEISGEITERSQDDEGLEDKSETILQDNDQGSHSVDGGNSPDPSSPDNNNDRMTITSEIPSVKNLGGIGLSISADSARKNVYNVDKSDGIVVGIIGLLGALVASGHLRFGSRAGPDTTTNLLGVGLHDGGGTMFEDKVSLLLYALQKAFQAAPNRLMTNNVYTSLLAASVWHNSSTISSLHMPIKIHIYGGYSHTVVQMKINFFLFFIFFTEVLSATTLPCFIWCMSIPHFGPIYAYVLFLIFSASLHKYSRI